MSITQSLDGVRHETVTATDTTGNTVTQTIRRAYRIA